jgi:hypothetical protein
MVKSILSTRMKSYIMLLLFLLGSILLNITLVQAAEKQLK